MESNGKENVCHETLHICPKTGRIIEPAGGRTPKKVKWPWLMPIIGFFALLWFLIRVVPKPRRITYPCQRLAAPLAWNFIAGFAAFFGLPSLYRGLRRMIKSKVFLVVSGIFTVAAMAAVLNIAFFHVFSYASKYADPDSKPNSPVGTARGIYPGRVVWAYDANATSWDGVNGCYWDDNNTSQTIVSNMFGNSIKKLTGQSTEKKSWDSIFKFFNSAHGNGAAGYKAGEKIAVKVNLNQTADQGAPDNSSITSPQVLYSLLNSLIAQAGIKPSSICVFDASRTIPDIIYDKSSSGIFKGIKFEGFEGFDGRKSCLRDLNAVMHWSFDVKGSTTYLPKCVTGAKYFINLATLKGHNLAGISLCAKNNFGTIMTDQDGQPTSGPPQGANIHGYVAAVDFNGGTGWTWNKRPFGTYNALVDLMGHKDLGGKTLLYMIDALYPVKNQGAHVDSGSRWQMKPFNGDWMSSIFLSLDGVAVDSVGFDFLNSEPSIKNQPDVLQPDNTADNYLIEAALAGNPLSKTFYDPESDGTRLKSLGVHEHWNNPADKKYSRNLGKGKGIELIKVDSKKPAGK